MGKMQREKGKRGERELAKELRELGFNECKRGQQFSGIEGEDVVGIEGVHIECKRTETLRLYEALDQAIRDADGKKIPIVCHKKNRGEFVAVLRLRDVVEFAKIIIEQRKDGEE